MEDNYIPYGPEWENEMMKLPKKTIISLLKKAQIRLHAAEKYIEESPCDPDITTAQIKAYAEWKMSKR